MTKHTGTMYINCYRRLVRRKFYHQYTVLGLTTLLEGCGRVPSINVKGAFFPGWLLCFVIGLAAGIIIRLVIIRAGLEIFGAPFFYALTGLAAAFLSWILIFGL
ncbi:MAG: hypothetical protein Pg6C_17570 [Treponemataceae bacterium]|nr:MAG: hypothetical protein Pg6C_17570 [Treponemataceae bacterium]